MPTTRLTLPRYLDDLIVLAARLLVGVVLVAHGWQKFSQAGWTGPVDDFTGMGAPMPEIAAPLAMFAELVCGALICLGLFTAPAALAVSIQMGVAFYLVHMANGLFVADGGWELVGMIGAASLLLAAYGPGRLSIDALVWPDHFTSRAIRKEFKQAEKRRRERLAAEAASAEAAAGAADSAGAATGPAAGTATAAGASADAQRPVGEARIEDPATDRVDARGPVDSTQRAAAAVGTHHPADVADGHRRPLE